MRKPDISQLIEANPHIDTRETEAFLHRLERRYFKRFSWNEMNLHLQGLSGLSPTRPVEVLLNQRKDGRIDCTVLAFDYPSEFSVIAGILTGSGLSILSGDVFTYRNRPDARGNAVQDQPQPVDTVAESIWNARRKIIDHFTGVLDTSIPFSSFSSSLGNDCSASPMIP